MPEAVIVSRHSLLWAQSGNAIKARPVALGTWNVIRMGFLWSVRQDVLGVIQPDFAFGFSSGTSAVYGDASATHFVGITTEGTAFGGWALHGTNFLFNAVFRPTKQVGATKTNGTNLTTSGVVYANTTADNKRSLWFVEITKGSPNYSFKLFHRNDVGATNPSHTDLVAVMESASPALANHVFTAAQTLAVDEGADGTLNAINFYWNLTSSNTEVDEIMVTKVS